MRFRVVGVIMLATALCQALHAQEIDGQKLIEGYLGDEARRLDDKFLAGIQSKADWEKQRPKLKEQYLEMLGLWPLPERTPLHAQITGTIERSEGFVIEKLHFQSRPHLYVTGNLYRPKDIPAGQKLPAVLYVCGHSGRGRDGNKAAFQHHGMWFATNGYVCLVIDTLQLGEIAAIHHGTYRYDRWWWQSRGYTPAAVECWNGIRGLDYLQSRPEVDGDKIAVTGISGGGAATFWIAAADERVKVAVPVSGMSDLEDYVGRRVINGHCDCMFLINTHQGAWTNIAALIAPRPMLFENSGHDTIFPMESNDRIRGRLEALYRLYTDKPAELFDIGVTPGGHSDNPELRLMAYRWINRHLKGNNDPVTEPVLPPEEGPNLRAFPGDLPADEINTKIDELFVPAARPVTLKTADEFRAWREQTIGELRRLSFVGHRNATTSLFAPSTEFTHEQPTKGIWITQESDAVESLTGSSTPASVACLWHYWPPKGDSQDVWIVVLGPDDSIDQKPDWAASLAGSAAVLLVSPRGGGSLRWKDPAPFYIQRSMALLGRTVDSGRVADVAALIDYTHYVSSTRVWKIAGKGQAGMIAAYAAALAPEHCIQEVVLFDPPTSHRTGPTFVNVLRVVDLPDALGLLAPRDLTVHTSHAQAFEQTSRIYAAAGGKFTIEK